MRHPPNSPGLLAGLILPSAIVSFRRSPAAQDAQAAHAHSTPAAAPHAMAAEHTAVVLSAFDAANPLSGAKLAQVPTAEPGPGEVQVKLLLAGVNRECSRARVQQPAQRHSCWLLTETLALCQPQSCVSLSNAIALLTRTAPASDMFSLMGVYPGFTSKLPAVPGFDGAASSSGVRAAH